jgi:hypothetical protein
MTLVSRFYQLQTGHYLTGKYLQWTMEQPTAKCSSCRYSMETRDHLFNVCPRWKPQEKTLGAEVRKESGRVKGLLNVRDLLADRGCSQPVLDFLCTTDVWRRDLPLVENDTESSASEWELHEWREREEERRAETEKLGTDAGEPLLLPTPAFMASAEEE